MEFDEDKAIEYIRQQLSDDVKNLYDDDEILNVIDIIWDYYEDNGFLDISGDDDDDADIDDIVDYVKSMLKKDKEATIKAEHVYAIVEAELDYEKSLEDNLF